MAYGDEMRIGNIKDSRLFYQKPNERSFNDSWINVQFIIESGWCYTLEFKNRKEWFKFVRRINHINKIIKAKNIELVGDESNE